MENFIKFREEAFVLASMGCFPSHEMCLPSSAITKVISTTFQNFREKRT